MNTVINRTQPNRQYHPLAHRIFLAFPSFTRHLSLGAMTTPD